MAKMVKVRVAVAVDEHGRWGAGGWSNSPPQVLAEDALGATHLRGARLVHFVTAELPVPEPLEVAGVVEGEEAERRYMAVDMAEPGSESTGYVVRMLDGSFREATPYEVEHASRVLDKRTLVTEEDQTDA